MNNGPVAAHSISTVNRALSKMQEAQLIRGVTDGDDATYQFKHALVQETAHASLLLQERKRLNLLVGQALEDLYPALQVELAPALSRHFSIGGATEKSVHYGMIAGDQARRVYALTEALMHYTSAIESVEHANIEAHELQELYLKRGRTLELMNDFDRALENYGDLLRAAEMRQNATMQLAAMMAQATIFSVPSNAYNPERSQQLNDQAIVLARKLEDVEAEAKILWNLMLLHSRAGVDYARALRYGNEALEIARLHHLQERLAYLQNDMSMLLLFEGEPQRAKEFNLIAREYWRETGNLSMLADNLGYAVVNHLFTAEFSDAIERSQEAARVSREIGNEWSEAWAITSVGTAYLERGNVAAALEAMDDAVCIGKRVFPPAVALAGSELSRLHSDLGEVKRGIELGEKFLASTQELIPTMLTIPACGLAHTYLIAGEIKRARELIGGLPDVLADSDKIGYAIDVTRPRVELALAEQDFEYALTLSTTFLERVRQLGLVLYEVEALSGHALALLGLGQFEQAVALRESVMPFGANGRQPEPLNAFFAR